MLIFIYMFFLHFVADFFFQSREMGQKKSSELLWLLVHILIQFFVFFIGLLYVLTPLAAYQIACANACLHGIVDWYIWKLYKWNVGIRLKRQFKDDEEAIQFHVDHWEYWKDKAFYTTIGFDQFLHMSTIVLVVWMML